MRFRILLQQNNKLKKGAEFSYICVVYQHHLNRFRQIDTDT